MKKIFTLIAIAAIALSCTKDGGKLDPNAMVSLRPAASVKSDNPQHLSALETVKQATALEFWNTGIRPNLPSGRGFADVQRDLVAPRLLMWGTDIIRQSGEMETDFIEGWDMVLTRNKLQLPYEDFDTIGYIPNRVVRAAESAIKKAFSEENYTECYKLFDEAFTFIPITGAEWREMMADEHPELIGTSWKHVRRDDILTFGRTSFTCTDNNVFLKKEYNYYYVYKNGHVYAPKAEKIITIEGSVMVVKRDEYSVPDYYNKVQ